MPRIGSFGLSRRTKYKLELNHVIRVAVNKHVFGETKFAYLRVTLDVLTEKLSRTKKNSAERKTRNQATFGSNCFYSDSFVARKINAKQKVAENWAQPRTGPHTVHVHVTQFLKLWHSYLL